MRLVICICVALLAIAQAHPEHGAKEDDESKAVDPSQIKYYLYTRDHIDIKMEMVIGDIQNADWLPWKKTQFIVHSHDHSSDSQYVLDMKLKFLTAYDSNVVTVDWRDPAGGLYNGAQERTRPSGEILGTFISFLGSLGSNMSDIHCVGFGLGAHACGFAGKVQTTGAKVGRITGLDASEENFDYNNPADRLHESDADFVDVIHTCGGWRGFKRPLGHADFFPNDGTSSQPGCGIELIDGDCSHNRAYRLFTESITSASFRSLRCDSWNDFKDGACNGNEELSMGDKCPDTARGAYYLETWGEEPFAQG